MKLGYGNGGEGCPKVSGFALASGDYLLSEFGGCGGCRSECVLEADEVGHGFYG